MDTNESLQYDALGRLVSDVNGLDSFTYTYGDATVRITGRKSKAGPQLAASYLPPTQDGLLRQLTYTSTAGTVLAQYGYAFDARHNVTSFSASSSGATLYSYDVYSQLRTAYLPNGAVFTVTPDPRGNVLSTQTVGPSQFNGSDVFVPSTTTSWTYDSANKMTQQTTSVVALSGNSTVSQPVVCDGSVGSLDSIAAGTAQALQYGYDNSNRVASYQSGNSSPPSNASGFAYDGPGVGFHLFRTWTWTASIFPHEIYDEETKTCHE